MCCNSWTKWFAWYPVLVDGKWVFFKTIERRRTDPVREIETFKYRHRKKCVSAWFNE
jgi:hypothetical protein